MIVQSKVFVVTVKVTSNDPNINLEETMRLQVESARQDNFFGDPYRCELLEINEIPEALESEKCTPNANSSVTDKGCGSV